MHKKKEANLLHFKEWTFEVKWNQGMASFKIWHVTQKKANYLCNFIYLLKNNFKAGELVIRNLSQLKRWILLGG